MNSCDFSNIRSSKILITGATGVVGREVVKLSIENDCDVILPVRNIIKATKLFSDNLDRIKLVKWRAGEQLNLDDDIDYIVHLANSTSSIDFIKKPVDIINDSYLGTKNILDLAVEKNVEKVIYVSSAEVYGIFDEFRVIDETTYGDFEFLAARSCYPQVKRMCETLCVSYFEQYKIPTVIARLCVVLGPITDINDDRAIAQFAKCAAREKNIILHTKGNTTRSYCDVRDVADALFILIEKGKASEAYNIANPNINLSIKEIAETISENFINTKVLYELKENCELGYLKETRLKLSSEKIYSLGWRPKVSLEDSLKKVIKSVYLLDNLI